MADQSKSKRAHQAATEALEILGRMDAARANHKRRNRVVGLTYEAIFGNTLDGVIKDK